METYFWNVPSTLYIFTTNRKFSFCACWIPNEISRMVGGCPSPLTLPKYHTVVFILRSTVVANRWPHDCQQMFSRVLALASWCKATFRLVPVWGDVSSPFKYVMLKIRFPHLRGFDVDRQLSKRVKRFWPAIIAEHEQRSMCSVRKNWQNS